MMKRIFFFLLSVIQGSYLIAQTLPEEKPPIIDMHLHAFPANVWGNPAPTSWAPKNQPAARTDEELLQKTLVMMEQYNIIKAVTSGPLEYVYKWRDAAPDRIIASPLITASRLSTFEYLEKEYQSKHLGAMGEIATQLGGLSPSNEKLVPFFDLAEKLDIPVGIHMGLAPPGLSYRKYRMHLGNPLLLEDVLIRHPKLRLYVMHAGWPLLNEMIALLHGFPQVYVDVSFIDWHLPQKEFHFYLRRLVEAGFGNRIMFGSDQNVWPDAIRIAIESINSADFLSEKQKRDIFYNNAVRFLKIEDETEVSK